MKTQDCSYVDYEGAHEPSEDPFWQESWYFNFADKAANVFGLTRIGCTPAKGTADGILLAMIQGKPALLYPGVGKKLKSKDVEINPPELLKVGGLEFVCASPMEEWLLSLHTKRVDIDIEYTAITPMYMFPEVSAGEGKSAAASHYEQAGPAKGRLRFGGSDIEIDGWGQRDHSWGPRHWSGVGSWTWISAQFPSGWAFNYWGLGQGPPAKTCGFVGDTDGAMDLVKGKVKYKGDRKGRRPSAAQLDLTLADGSQREVGFEKIGMWPLYKNGAIITETFGLFTCRGETGVGVVERLYKPRLGPLSMLPHIPRQAAIGLYCL